MPVAAASRTISLMGHFGSRRPEVRFTFLQPGVSGPKVPTAKVADHLRLRWMKPHAPHLGIASSEIQGIFKAIRSPEQVVSHYKRRRTENSYGFGPVRLPP